MTQLRKHAWFQLVVIAVGTAAFLLMLVITGNVMASFAGFAVLGLLGVPHLVNLRKRNWLVRDERDQTIRVKAESVGYAAVWTFLVIWAVWVGTTFADEGQVPMVYVAPVVWVGWMVMISARAVATLTLDRLGA
jgi:hypothetical protein